METINRKEHLEAIEAGINEGLRKAQQTMYSKEELLDAYRKGARNGSNAGMKVARGGEMNLLSAEEWFEQNKKK